ncbi:uncharacterized protein F4812DRAFT_165071 [Daldinia caldariorum]|uniref:uncharacterized protein n=1 Tax=Daldinia caldariorum TaxID=326644 RepID=UPI0020085983|nr:uncharacterized protein F4812DRAFT_165071 [Daldinia caldariorum]KAI1471068.1 hypothetical protein F4812DRAFT_165071 [Daldinia caldariorum]
MLQSGLLRCSLLIALGTIGIWANEHARGHVELTSHRVARVPRGEESLFRKNCFYRAVVEEDKEIKRLIIEEIPEATQRRRSPKEQAAPALIIPQPTPPPPPPPQKRQDDGQIQALSQQLRSLSESATRAISSVSSSASSAMSLASQSAQSVQQSADQAVRAASQSADEASRQLAQTQSSAASAVSAASARASDDLARSLASMSSRISSNLASVQSSASSMISAARAEASSSAASAVNIAASKIQEARAGASGVRTDVNPAVSQVQSDSISGTNLAIIVTVSVVGTAILTAIASYFVVRYRRKRRRERQPLAAAAVNHNESQYDKYEKPIAVRGTIGTPRFTPFGGGTGYPMDKFKLPDLGLSPFLRKKTNEEIPGEIGFAKSAYSSSNSNNDGGVSVSGDVYGVSPASFRLQKDNSIKSATSVRLIRVGSNNSKGKEKAKEEDQKALLSPILSPAPSLPRETPTPTPTVPSAPVTVSPAPPPEPISPVSPTSPVSPVESDIAEPRRAATRPVRNPEPVEKEEPVLSPTTIPTTTMTSQNRLRFRDSSEVESAEPSPVNWRLSSARAAAATNLMRNTNANTNTSSLRTTTTTTSPGGSDSGQSPPRRPKNAGASFATFPKVRNGPPRGSTAEAILNRNRAGINSVTARLREEAERRQRELAEAGGGGNGNAARTSRDGPAEARSPNWPFGSTQIGAKEVGRG